MLHAPSAPRGPLLRLLLSLGRFRCLVGGTLQLLLATLQLAPVFLVSPRTLLTRPSLTSIPELARKAVTSLGYACQPSRARAFGMVGFALVR